MRTSRDGSRVAASSAARLSASRWSASAAAALARTSGDASASALRSTGHFASSSHVVQQPHQRRLVHRVLLRLGDPSSISGSRFQSSFRAASTSDARRDDRGLVVARIPLADPGVGPGRVLVGVAEVAGVGRLEGEGRGRRGRQHRVVAAVHRGEPRHRHVARDALVPLAARLVVAVLGRVVDVLLVARGSTTGSPPRPSNRGRPLGVWQWLQSSLPEAAQGLISHDV